MYFDKKIKTQNKLYKKKLVKFESKFNINSLNLFISNYPKLKGGRKNYIKKEINISKNICLTKLYKYSKKMRTKKITKIKFKRYKNKIIINALLYI